MRNYLYLLLFPLLFAACESDPQTSETPVESAEKTIIEKAEWGKYFDGYGVHGCFLLYDLKAGEWKAYNPDRIDSAYIPASSFKVFNTMIVLDAGVIADTETKLPWDGYERWAKSWNQDLNLRQAMQYSAAWFYQELVDSMGTETFQHYLDTLNYGNRELGGPARLSWLVGGLRITAREQVELLTKLYHNDLPFSQRSMDIVREIIPQENGDDYIFRYKTGWAGMSEPEIGWLIGWVEKGEDTYLFAMNIHINEDEDTKARMGITKALFKDLNILP